MLVIDGSQGEGGGQMLRTSLSMAALTGRPFRLEKIRAGRRRPGLRPQHLTAVLATAHVCNAELEGAAIDSQALTFIPQRPPQADVYYSDVSDVSLHGSAGAVTLIFQTVLWPLLYAAGSSRVTLVGGTHVPFSPSFHYLQNVSVPSVWRFGTQFQLDLMEWGWMPKGEGQIQAVIEPCGKLNKADFLPRPEDDRIDGLAVVTNLPGHIPHRMSRRAENLLDAAEIANTVTARRLRGRAPGAGTFLWSSSGQGGAGGLGSKGTPAQTVAESAVHEMLEYWRSGAAVDEHLADQLLIPMVLAAGRSRLSTHVLSQHTVTNVSILRRWLPDVGIKITGTLGNPAEIIVDGIGWQASSNALVS